MLPILLLSARPEDAAARSEYDSFLAAAALRPEELEQVRLEVAGLPELDLSSYAGAILGGSPFGTTTDEDSKPTSQVQVEDALAEFLAGADAANLPCLATGFGFEVLAAYRGGVVDTTWGEESGQVTITLTPEGVADPIAAGLPRSFHTFVGHKEACSRLPEDAVLLARSSSCPIQMVRFDERTYGTQFNPEVDSEANVQRLEIYADAGYFPPDELDSLITLARSSGEHAASLVVRNFVNNVARAQ